MFKQKVKDCLSFIKNNAKLVTKRVVIYVLI